MLSIRRRGILASLLILYLSGVNAGEDEAPCDVEPLFTLSIEELLQVPVDVGSRGDSRSWQQSPVPVDIIDAAQLEKTGFISLNRILVHLLPYFNYQQMAIRDGSDHARPFSLRGMAPDQVLVLVNGKRYHPGALLHLSSALGKGSSSVDLESFPVRSIQRIEVLQDGAAAQYGSDAIAGIINIVLKQHVPAELQATTGQTATGDGETWSLFGQLPLWQDNLGFATVAGEVRHMNKTVRAGSDIRQQYFDGDPRNSQPAEVNMESADPNNRSATVTFNAERQMDKTRVYGFAKAHQRTSDAGGFFRRPLDNRTLRSLYPDGFLPRIRTRIKDYSATLGSRLSEVAGSPWQADISNTLGYNHMNYFVDNSVNVSMGDASPSHFDAGDLSFLQNTFNLDFSRTWEDKDTLAFGFEYRYERFEIGAGEPASYLHGSVAVLDGPNQGAQTQAGAQVFPGFQPDNAVDINHDALGAYIDWTYHYQADSLLQLASRFEEHEDFGTTFDSKVALLHHVSPELHLRASLSSGFRAPSLAQQHFSSTAISFLNHELVNLGTYGVDSPVARALGAQPLSPEQSRHWSLGFNWQVDDALLVSVNAFNIDIDDRIELSNTINRNPELFSAQVIDILDSYQVTGVRFFTNAINTRTKGMDISARHTWQTGSASRVNLTAKYHYSDTTIRGAVKTPQTLEPNTNVIFDRHGANRLTERVPNNNIHLAATWQWQDWDITLRANRFGSVKVVWNTADPERDQTLPGQWLWDLDIHYQLNADWSLAIGMHNLTDRFPAYSDTGRDTPFYGPGRIFQYSDASPFGYNGGFFYLRSVFRF